MTFAIEFTAIAEEHLRAMTVRQQRIVLEAVDEQLSFEPLRETRNRKPMRPNPLAPWELRIGELRVYYDVQVEPQKLVVVLAVGIKERNRVRIGGRIIDL